MPSPYEPQIQQAKQEYQKGLRALEASLAETTRHLASMTSALAHLKELGEPLAGKLAQVGQIRQYLHSTTKLVERIKD